MTKVFCAIDTTDISRARELAAVAVAGGAGIKLGLEFFCRHGLTGVLDVRGAAADAPFFLDLKWHDIPNTVAGAVAAVMDCAPDFMTVHASGGRAMLEAAATAAARFSRPPCLLAVTVLTHLSDEDVGQLWPGVATEDQVMRLAQLALDCGIGGIVSSPREVAGLRARFGKGPVLVVPGIRLEGAAVQDQKRTMTPAEAARAGADILVIGRPVTAAADPAAALEDIVSSLKNDSIIKNKKVG